MEKLEIAAGDGARVEACTHGAQVTSWKPASGEERLFLSSRSAFAADAAIRGGVPIIFPQFSGMGPLPKHGFARVSEWELARAGRAASGKGEGEAHLRLTSNDRTRAAWARSARVRSNHDALPPGSPDAPSTAATLI